MEADQKAGARAQVMQRGGQESLGPKAVREAEARPTRPHATLRKSPGRLEEDIQVLPLRTLISFTHLFLAARD